jgi:hypothetical protein
MKGTISDSMTIYPVMLHKTEKPKTVTTRAPPVRALQTGILRSAAGKRNLYYRFARFSIMQRGRPARVCGIVVIRK